MRHPPIRYAAGRKTGFSLVEVVMGFTFFSVSLFGIGALFVSVERSREVSAEDVQITHLFRRVAEDIRSVQFDQIPAQYSGYTFTDTETGATVAVTVFLDETDTSSEAGELGLPRDLDGDGLATNPSAVPYVLLPIRIQITWTNSDGAQSRSLYFLLSQE